MKEWQFRTAGSVTMTLKMSTALAKLSACSSFSSLFFTKVKATRSKTFDPS